MHSIPFAVLCGEIGYLLFVNSGTSMAVFAGGAVFLGCIIHLILDELNSITLKYFILPVIKRSSGTALKLWSDSLLPNLIIYFLIISFGVVIFGHLNPGSL